MTRLSDAQHQEKTLENLRESKDNIQQTQDITPKESDNKTSKSAD